MKEDDLELLFILGFCIVILIHYAISIFTGTPTLLVLLLIIAGIDVYYAFGYDMHIWEYYGWFENDRKTRRRFNERI